VIVFIDDHRSRFGVEPICRVLSQHGCQIAPRTYYANKARPVCARTVRDRAQLVEVRRVHHSARGGLYGARKVHAQLLREGHVLARCTVERLMRTAGLQGVSRGKRVRTTIPDKSVARAADLVNRDFTATRPNQLWVLDFTYSARPAVMCCPVWRAPVGVAISGRGAAHNHRSWRKARSWSPGLNRVGEGLGSSRCCRTASLAARSASRY
jgi:hypothetical protein